MSLNITIVLIVTICHIPVGVIYLGWVWFSVQVSNSEYKELVLGKSSYALLAIIGIWPFLTSLLLLRFLNDPEPILFSMHFEIMGAIYYVSSFYLIYRLMKKRDSKLALGVLALLSTFQRVSFLLFFIGLMELLGIFFSSFNSVLIDRNIFSVIFVIGLVISQILTLLIQVALKRHADIMR